MRLYDAAVSGNAYKVRLLLSHLGRDYESVPVDLMSGTSLHPGLAGKTWEEKVPAIEEDDGFVLAESNAILHYLAKGTPYLPDDPRGEALVLQWLFFEQNSHEPYLAVSRALRRFVAPSPARDARLASLASRARAALGVLERALEGRDFLVGDYSVADIALYAYTHKADEAGFALSGYPNIRAWCARVAARQGHVPFTVEASAGLAKAGAGAGSS